MDREKPEGMAVKAANLWTEIGPRTSENMDVTHVTIFCAL
jgi:hypothetical protein